MVIFGALHLVAFMLGLALFVMFLRSGSRSGFKPKTSPGGGIPLPSAEQSSQRLRSHERLADTQRSQRRRKVAEPHHPPTRRRITR